MNSTQKAQLDALTAKLKEFSNEDLLKYARQRDKDLDALGAYTRPLGFETMAEEEAAAFGTTLADVLAGYVLFRRQSQPVG